MSPIGFADAGSLINGWANSDVKIMEVVMIHAKPIHVVVFLKEDNNWKSSKDMVGAKIGSPAGASTRVTFPALAGANGFKYDDIKWITMPNGQVIPSMPTRKTDAAVLFATELPTIWPKAKKWAKPLKHFTTATMESTCTTTA